MNCCGGSGHDHGKNEGDEHAGHNSNATEIDWKPIVAAIIVVIIISGLVFMYLK